MLMELLNDLTVDAAAAYTSKLDGALTNMLLKVDSIALAYEPMKFSEWFLSLELEQQKAFYREFDNWQWEIANFEQFVARVELADTIFNGAEVGFVDLSALPEDEEDEEEEA